MSPTLVSALLIPVALHAHTCVDAHTCPLLTTGFFVSLAFVSLAFVSPARFGLPFARFRFARSLWFTCRLLF